MKSFIILIGLCLTFSGATAGAEDDVEEAITTMPSEVVVPPIEVTEAFIQDHWTDIDGVLTRKNSKLILKVNYDGPNTESRYMAIHVAKLGNNNSRCGFTDLMVGPTAYFKATIPIKCDVTGIKSLQVRVCVDNTTVKPTCDLEYTIDVIVLDAPEDAVDPAEAATGTQSDAAQQSNTDNGSAPTEGAAIGTMAVGVLFMVMAVVVLRSRSKRKNNESKTDNQPHFGPRETDESSLDGSHFTMSAHPTRLTTIQHTASSFRDDELTDDFSQEVMLALDVLDGAKGSGVTKPTRMSAMANVSNHSTPVSSPPPFPIAAQTDNMPISTAVKSVAVHIAEDHDVSGVYE
eukprot:m.261878 g.261878  ORF g.261878 m.261878 type:complete len:346 (+) comp43572_c0_seq1:213-1250(+)